MFLVFRLPAHRLGWVLNNGFAPRSGMHLVIATPTHAIRIKRPSAVPTGIDWTRLSAEDLDEMPILAELKRMTTSNA